MSFDRAENKSDQTGLGCACLLALAAASLLGCGGGGGGGGGGSYSPTPVTPTPSITVTCPNGQVSTGSSTDLANSGCAPAKILAVSPANGESSIAVDGFSGIVVTTDSVLDSSSTLPSGITVTAGSLPIAGKVAAVDAKSIKFVPAARLLESQTYSISGTLKDALGRSITLGAQFTTAIAPAGKRPFDGVAGSTNSPGSADGSMMSASFHSPRGMTLALNGDVLVADGCTGWFDSYGSVRRISTGGQVSTLVGGPRFAGVGADGINNRRCYTGLSQHPDGSLFVADPVNHVVLKISSSGITTIVAGAAGQTGTVDGPVGTSRLNANGIAIDAGGTAYIADTGNHTIRKLDAANVLSTIGGAAGQRGNTNGALKDALFNEPSTIKVSTKGELYVGDQNGVRKIETGVVSLVIPQSRLMADACGYQGPNAPTDIVPMTDGRMAVAICNHVLIYEGSQLQLRVNAGLGDSDGSVASSTFAQPYGLIQLPGGDLLISDTGNHNIRRLSVASDTIQLYAGQRSPFQTTVGPAITATISYPRCPVVNSGGEIVFSSNANVMLLSKTGEISKLISSDHDSYCPIAFRGDGSLVASKLPGIVQRFNETGTLLETLARDLPVHGAISINGGGEIFFGDDNGYVSRYRNGVIERFSDIQIGNSVVSNLIALDDGTVIAEGAGAIFRLNSTGKATVLAGKWRETGSADGPAGEARFGAIYSMTMGKDGAIYIGDVGTTRVRRILEGRVDTVVGVYGINETHLGSMPGSIGDVAGLAYDPSSNSLVVTNNSAIMRIRLP
ncbi:hypothetical protein LNV08_01395 [Paucibacter sp. TC2R-5]|uniref:hypothetical protein n=1 Tax=Paucibacter sp. TC2R-5 TaxID=2893555 RepID=UPI0021E50D5E|nr:hypothetical protein [Paucibacter sp. TC2R-5]MCV2357624.1 hypothetical protein [Paucibacter sp. TC2R-5]